MVLRGCVVGYDERVRCSSLLLVLFLSTACTKTDSDQPSDAARVEDPPTAAEPEPDTEGAPEDQLASKAASETGQAEQVVARAQCVATCVEASVAVAKPADVIEADCQAKCAKPPTEVDGPN